MNFVRDVIGARPGGDLALIELARGRSRRVWRFEEVMDGSARVAATLAARGIGRGDVVMTLIGNRPEWALSLLACWRLGAVALPCTEQLRAADLRLRIERSRPSLVIADERNRSELDAALAAGRGEVQALVFPAEDLLAAEGAADFAELGPSDPALITFTSGTSGEAKPVLHGHRYLTGQSLQAEHWLGAGPGDLVWCTAASGWSKSARNAFVAPWLRGAAVLFQDARFDPEERLATIEGEGVTVLCMAPTEYRVIAKRTRLRPLPSLTACVAAGEALDPGVLAAWKEATGLEVRDGYGQTETGQLTTNPPDRPARPGSMGVPLPGVGLWVDEGELVVDPATVPTFFLGYGSPREEEIDEYRTGDRVRIDDDGYLYFEGRADDVIISAGYRIGPFEVESALVSHPAVVEAAVVAAPDPERGSVVRAVVVPVAGAEPGEELARALQDHVKATTAPYKYPRIVEFAGSLPKTSSGKVRRALLRGGGGS